MMMNSSSIFKIFALISLFMLFLTIQVSAAPTYASDDNNSIRELVELLLEQEKNNSFEKKAGRSPQLRLRFGKRLDSSQYAVPFGYIPAINDYNSNN